ncbi:hypothetical protein [Luteimonas kalidii]|uniref:Uncharacterized protein n=1 Tax=Luteimonas kalidii TaxID=3042025 RepID=A0ABT6JSN9_9GAMM|nr:hypothetical protein [Luteimonas kalidii]MDH5833708.1 hypothetical protein [Luteimonas kalidii]
MHASTLTTSPRTAGRARALLLAACLGAVPVLAQSAPVATPPGTPATSEPRQRAATTGDETMDNAVAAVVVAALSEQLSTATIAVNIDSFDVAIASVRDRTVSGTGRLRVGDDAEWIGFRYSVPYDTSFGSAGYPRLTIGGVAASEREVPNDAGLVQQLEDRVAVELDRQFGADSSRLQLDDISTVQGGARLLRISANGIADFGRNGNTPVRIEALYDQVANAWQRVNYELGVAAR